MSKSRYVAAAIATMAMVAASLVAVAASSPGVLAPEVEAALAGVRAESAPDLRLDSDEARCARFSMIVYRGCLEHAVSRSSEVGGCRRHYEDNLGRCRAAIRQ